MLADPLASPPPRLAEASSSAADRFRPIAVHPAIVRAKVSDVHARARIELAAAADDGLSDPMPSPCRSLILRVEHNAPGEDDMNLVVQITTASGEPLSPGSSEVVVHLHFWSDLADVFIVPNTQFTLRYPNRLVGRGQVLDVLPI